MRYRFVKISFKLPANRRVELSEHGRTGGPPVEPRCDGRLTRRDLDSARAPARRRRCHGRRPARRGLRIVAGEPPRAPPVPRAVPLLGAPCGSPPSTAPPAPTSAESATATTAGARASAACAAGAQAPPNKVTGAPLDTLLRVAAKARGHRAPLI